LWGPREKGIAELKEIREEIRWFKESTFAGHLLQQLHDIGRQIEENKTTGEIFEIARDLRKISQELEWHRQESYSAQVLSRLDEINGSLSQVDNCLTEMADSLSEIKGR
jgi:hypothetical protein